MTARHRPLPHRTPLKERHAKQVAFYEQGKETMGVIPKNDPKNATCLCTVEKWRSMRAMASKSAISYRVQNVWRPMERKTTQLLQGQWPTIERHHFLRGVLWWRSLRDGKTMGSRATSPARRSGTRISGEGEELAV